MTIELERVAGNRRLYEVAGVGTLRFEGVLARKAIVQAGERTWRVAWRGLFGRHADATAADGTLAGTFQANALRRGGTVRWDGDELVLRPASAWRERYALVDGERELALFDGKGWGRRPVRINVDDGAAVDHGLLLFAAFVVRRLAEDAGAAAGAAASAAPTT
jgi:hypothetical protein